MSCQRAVYQWTEEVTSAPSSLNFGVEPLQFHAGVFDAELPATPILSLEVALVRHPVLILG